MLYIAYSHQLYILLSKHIQTGLNKDPPETKIESKKVAGKKLKLESYNNRTNAACKQKSLSANKTGINGHVCI